jgi:hypothetical protein
MKKWVIHFFHLKIVHNKLTKVIFFIFSRTNTLWHSSSQLEYTQRRTEVSKAGGTTPFLAKSSRKISIFPPKKIKLSGVGGDVTPPSPFDTPLNILLYILRYMTCNGTRYRMIYRCLLFINLPNLLKRKAVFYKLFSVEDTV